MLRVFEQVLLHNWFVTGHLNVFPCINSKIKIGNMHKLVAK